MLRPPLEITLNKTDDLKAAWLEPLKVVLELRLLEPVELVQARSRHSVQPELEEAIGLKAESAGHGWLVER